jgi:hypothetical protein
MASQETAKNVSTPVDEYIRMSRKWHLMDLVMGGTESMRRSDLLPQEEKESNEAFKIRKNRSVLFNFTKEAINDFVGKAFSKELQYDKEKFDDRLLDLFDDIDMEGRDLHRFARKVFYAAQRDRVTYLLAEFPNVNPIKERLNVAPDAPLTQAQIKENNVRPYLNHIDARNMIEPPRYTVQNEERKIWRIRFREDIYEKDDESDWGWKLVEQVREMFPGGWRLHRKKEQESGEEEWVIVDEGALSLDFIPIVEIVCDPEAEGEFEGDLPMEDIMYLNILHFQALSDRINLMRFAQRWATFAKGISREDQKELKWGPSSFSATSNENADMKIVEHSGRTIQSGKEYVEQIEEWMEKSAASHLERRPGDVTAREVDRDERKSNSKLGVNVRLFEDALELAFHYLALWLGLDPRVDGVVDHIRLNTEFEEKLDSQQKLDYADKARGRMDITQKTHLDVMRKHGVLDEDHDIEAEVANTRQEQADNAMNLLGVGSG